MNRPPVVIVLASGRGNRFLASGGSTHKLQTILGLKSVLQHTLDAVAQSGLPWHLEQGDHLCMGDSIAAAVSATGDYGGWLIMPGDLPLIQSETIMTIAVALRNAEVVVPTYLGQRGHPVGFGTVCRQALMNLQGAVGARRIINAHQSMQLAVTDVGSITDIDTMSDLRAVEHIFYSQSLLSGERGSDLTQTQ